jgi:hypothetical protein
MWNPDQHSDEDNLRWAWRRAGEWRHWPLFLSQPIVPVLFYFYDWVLVTFFVLLVTFIWWLIVSPRFIWLGIADLGPALIKLKFVSAPIMAYLIWQSGNRWSAVLALIWPFLGVWIVSWLLTVLEAPLSSTRTAKASQTGSLQKRFMSRLGYERPPSKSYRCE